MKAPTSERMLQTHVVAELMRLAAAGCPILFAGDMGGNRRTRSEQQWAKATGLVRGEPDLRVYGPGGRILLIEMKTATGALSSHQKARHARFRELGHVVLVLRAESGPEAAQRAREAVRDWLETRNGAPARECDANAGRVGATESMIARCTPQGEPIIRGGSADG